MYVFFLPIDIQTYLRCVARLYRDLFDKCNKLVHMLTP